MDDNSGWLSKVDKLRSLHTNIESFLKPLLMIAKTELTGSTKTGQKILLHLLLASNVADLSEIEDLLGMKRSSVTFSPCHTRFAKWKDFPYCKSADRRNLGHTKYLWMLSTRARRTPVQKIASRS